MDLVALVAPAPAPTKGADGGAGHAVTLWRLNGGPRVWTKDVGGWVEGLGWSPDGLRLALYVRSTTELTDDGKATLAIHSVHDGERLQSVDAPALDSGRAGDKGKGRAGGWGDGRVKLDWTWTTEGAPVPFGSAVSIIASLPHLHPHEPTPAPSTHSFLPLSLPSGGSSSTSSKPQAPACLTPALPRLAHPVLPPLPPEAPRSSILRLTLFPSNPTVERPTTFPFLSGSFPLPPSPTPSTLSHPTPFIPTPETHAFARTATALDELLRYLALGIDDLRESWVGKAGGGTVMREWVGAIGEALRVHGEEEGDVRRALGSLLMTGRPGEGLMNVLGGKLTPRTLGRWESTVLTSLTTIRQACYADLAPAAERLLLLLKELHGWSLWPERYAAHLKLDRSAVEQAISIATALAHELAALERQARDEHDRFAHFCLWLAYEIATAAANASQDSAEDDPLLEGKHNVLLVADYIQAGLTEPSVDPFFVGGPAGGSTADVLALVRSFQSEGEGERADADRLRDRLGALVGRLADVVARPSTTSAARPYPHNHDPSSSTAGHSLLRSPVLNRSLARLPSPVKRPPPTPAERSRRNDGFGAMDDDSSVDMSMSMELDQSSASAPALTANTAAAAAAAGTSINAAPVVMDEGDTSVDVDAPRRGAPAAAPIKCAPTLPAIVDALVGVIRDVVEDALAVGPVENQRRQGQAEVFDRSRRARRVEGEEAQLALLAGEAQSSRLWLIKRSATDELLAASCDLRVDAAVLGANSADELAADVLDLGFFTSDELVLLLSVGVDDDAKYLLASIDLSTVEYQATVPPSSPSAPVDPWLASLIGTHVHLSSPTLPLARVRHLTSLDRLPRPPPSAHPDAPEPPPLASLALNGAKGRMTGSVLAWAGREMVVFDLAEDEEDEESEDTMED